MAVADYSGQAWLQGFNEIGQTIFGMSGDELVTIRVSFPTLSINSGTRSLYA